MRPIAINLPQFHEMEINNIWWGKGFTEWTHVTRATPLFPGHQQPVKPLGGAYYDMTDAETLRRQTEWMKRAGVYGMAYYHYWYEDRPLMQSPVQLLLEHSEIEQRYMLYWSNTEWYFSKPTQYQRALILHQEYGEPENWEKHIRYLLRFFQDPRYIQVDGKPVLCIYRPGEIPHYDEMITLFRRVCEEVGFNGLYVIETMFNYGEQPYHSCSDAVVYREPNCCKKQCSKQLLNGSCRDSRVFSTGIPQKILSYRYDEAVQVSIREQAKLSVGKKHYHSVFTGWDNTPRHGYLGYVFLGSNPELFRQYSEGLSAHIEDPADFLFVNAWNEWAEGMHMEPCEEFGYGYLDALRSAVSSPVPGFEEKKQEDYFTQLLHRIRSADVLLLYGAGRYGKELLQIIRSAARSDDSTQLILFLDDTPAKQGASWCGVPVVSSEEGVKRYPDSLIILCADERSHPLLLQKLNRLHVSRENIVIPEIAFWDPKLDPAYLQAHDKELSCVANLLADSRSSDVFRAVLRYKMHHDTKLLQMLADPIGLRYFDPEITAPIPEGVYFDCGSFCGDTVEAFLAASKRPYSKIICCEPAPKNYEALCRTVEKLGVKDAVLFQKAVWRRAQEKMPFQTVSALSGVLSEKGDIKVETATVDQLAGNERVGFLKVEVNGSEYDALLGGIGVIERDHPLVAVSVYHNTVDLIRIPLLLKSLYPDYRLVLRYYGLRTLTDIVCYAVPPSENQL